MPGFSMKICYTPHDVIDFSEGATIHVEGQMADPMCVGSRAESNDPDCPENSYTLSLGLSETDRERCSTDIVFPDVSESVHVFFIECYNFLSEYRQKQFNKQFSFV